MVLNCSSLLLCNNQPGHGRGEVADFGEVELHGGSFMAIYRPAGWVAIRHLL